MGLSEEISIHAPRAGSDDRRCEQVGRHHDFNPRSPCGERRALANRSENFKDSNPRSPCGGRLVVLLDSSVVRKFQSTLPVRGATRRLVDRNSRRKFQSTLPVRGATYTDGQGGDNGQDFNPRSPCGERLHQDVQAENAVIISIHAPRAGSDPLICKAKCSPDISIHAPRAGSDVVADSAEQKSIEISIHAPRAGSDCRSWSNFPQPLIFQSTLPVRGATANTSIFLYEFPACLLSSPYKSDMSHFPRCFS